MVSTLKRRLTTIIEELTKGSKSEDMVRLTVMSPSLDYLIVLRFMTIPANARIDKHEEWKSIRTGESIQETIAKALHDEANVPFWIMWYRSGKTISKGS